MTIFGNKNLDRLGRIVYNNIGSQRPASASHSIYERNMHMSEKAKDIEYIMPEKGSEKLFEKIDSSDKNSINWDPEFVSYKVEEYSNYYNYDGIFSTETGLDEIFRNKVCLYETMKAAMDRDDIRIIAFACSDFIKIYPEDYVAFCAESDIDGTPIKKDDRVFVDLYPEADDAPGIFVIKKNDEYVLEYLESIEGKQVCGFVCDIKERYGESKCKKE